MIEFFFDCSSPWTYLAFTNIQPLAAEFGVEITWRPILVGGIFNTINPSVYEGRSNPVPAKARYSGKDLQDWARVAGLKIKMPPTVFPVNSVKAMRTCLVLGADLDISQDAVLREICAKVGLDADTLLAAQAADDIKAQLRANTDAVMARGGFGSPTIFVGGTDMYFGNDRLPLVRAALERAA